MVIDVKLLLSKRYFLKLKILRIFVLPLHSYRSISHRLSIQFNIYQSHENVVLFFEHIMLASLKLRVEMSHPIYGTRRNWSMTRIIALLNVDVQKTNTFIQETAFAWKMIGEAFFHCGSIDSQNQHHAVEIILLDEVTQSWNTLIM